MEALSVLKMEGISKEFPGVHALRDVDFDLRPGEIHAVVGENGAGKSTLMKILFGVHRADAGRILLHGKEVSILNPSHAQRLGISMVHQELNLVPTMNAAQNIALGHEPTHRIGLLKWPQLYSAAAAGLAQVGAGVDARVPVRKLSIAQRQLVEIAKALSWNAQILVMDEPTSSLTESEIDALFDIMHTLTDRSVSIVFITHHMDEVFEIADRVTVLRDGRHVKTCRACDLDRASLIQMMVGRSVDNLFTKDEYVKGSEALRVEHLTRTGVLHDISFAAHYGEILGIAGLMGAGRTELARAVFGADSIDAGDIYIDGKRAQISSPEDAIQRGLSLLTEDRKGQGLILLLSVKHNIALAALDKVSPGIVLDSASVGRVAARYVRELDIKTPSLDRPVKFLSGGNQQKTILAKWLCRDAKIFIFDEPTRGIDVGAKAEVYRLMNRLALEGACIIMISSELPEILAMSDRVLVMREGCVVAELPRELASQETIMAHATGSTRGA